MIGIQAVNTAAQNSQRRKVVTGIEGFDEITAGGLPRGRTTLVMGEPGAGKTIFALQALVSAVRQGDPGIFVAFEERTDDIITNAEAFGWDVGSLRAAGRLFFLDAHIPPDIIRTGGFDLGGLLATLRAQCDEMGAEYVVFDAIDVVLRHLDSRIVQRQEVYRLHSWLIDSHVTGLLTASLEGQGDDTQPYGHMQAIADCVVLLTQHVIDRVLLRELRVLKYRGSAFLANEFPVVISEDGLEVAALAPTNRDYPVYTERVSTGVERLDTMLRGGYLRGTSVLITGAPGTAKSTLCGAFVQAACRRGERALFLSFDEVPSEIIRNLASVDIHLRPYVDSGLLALQSGRTEVVSAEEHLIALKLLIRKHQPSCVVIDPLSAIVKAGGAPAALSMAKRLLHLAKSQGITLLCTSLLDSSLPDIEATPLQISTLADTWLHVAYVALEGERNRSLTIVKSRGTPHSNQVRELVLTSAGPTLTDVYTAEGRVLMGTARWQQEQREARERQRLEEEMERRRRDLEQAEAELLARIDGLQRQLHNSRAELALLERQEADRAEAYAARQVDLRTRRGALNEIPNQDDGDRPAGWRTPAAPPERAGGA